MKPTFTEQHVNHSLQEDKPSHHVKDNDNSCTCNAGEKSVRFNLPTKTRPSDEEAALFVGKCCCLLCFIRVQSFDTFKLFIIEDAKGSVIC